MFSLWADAGVEVALVQRHELGDVEPLGQGTMQASVAPSGKSAYCSTGSAARARSLVQQNRQRETRREARRIWD
jgi:hypothetical protein